MKLLERVIKVHTFSINLLPSRCAIAYQSHSFRSIVHWFAIQRVVKLSSRTIIHQFTSHVIHSFSFTHVRQSGSPISAFPFSGNLWHASTKPFYWVILAYSMRVSKLNILLSSHIAPDRNNVINKCCICLSASLERYSHWFTYDLW